MAEVNAITTAANGGLALIGGWYLYVTLPYLYVSPIIEIAPELGICTLQFNRILTFGGPDACKGSNYDNDEKTCDSDMTIKDTMGDQGRPGM